MCSTSARLALDRVAGQAVDLVRLGDWSVSQQRLGSPPYRTGSRSLANLGATLGGNVAKAVATECGPHQAQNDENRNRSVLGSGECGERVAAVVGGEEFAEVGEQRAVLETAGGGG